MTRLVALQNGPIYPMKGNIKVIQSSKINFVELLQQPIYQFLDARIVPDLPITKKIYSYNSVHHNVVNK